MLHQHIEKVSRDLSLDPVSTSAVAKLLDSGATIPFIARYRKEATGNLDEVAIANIRDSLSRLRLVDERKAVIIRSLAKQGKLSGVIEERLKNADSLAELEDIYLPFRPKRRTRAMAAKERGLEPLAKIILAQEMYGEGDPHELAFSYVDPEKGVPSVKDALDGAKDIIAEWISEDAQARSRTRELFWRDGILQSRAASASHPELQKFRDYLDLSMPVCRMSSHRLLAVLRGAKRGALDLHISPGKEDALAILEEIFIKGDGPISCLVMEAAEDSYQRLLAPSLERETLALARERAEKKAIEVFAHNLRQLLLEPPLGQKRVLAIDPGFRSGCKLVVLDRLGRLVMNHVIYPHEPHNKMQEAEAVLLEICRDFEVEVIAVGNGTAGRETELFLRSLGLPGNIAIVSVDESGASVYSASETARNEFPQVDATVRGAVSIGRRLMDPLAELVKIDPEAIGVGQYQHDLDPSELRRALDDVVMACVNQVGVDLNAASKELLARVAGLGPKLAEAIVKYRNKNGLYRSRQDLLKVPRLGPKVFEQAAGFLRIRGGDNPLDSTAVHPESYPVVEKMARNIGVTVAEIMQNEELLQSLDLEGYRKDGIGRLTLEDILNELSRPGRDPRQEFEAFSFAPGVERIDDLQTGMRLPGIVTNVTSFGAFVDVGVHQVGLVHRSELSDGFVLDPNEVVSVRQRVSVMVLDVDLKRKRIALSMKR